jgi:hypothetical protein
VWGSLNYDYCPKQNRLGRKWLMWSFPTSVPPVSLLVCGLNDWVSCGPVSIHRVRSSKGGTDMRGPVGTFGSITCMCGFILCDHRGIRFCRLSQTLQVNELRISTTLLVRIGAGVALLVQNGVMGHKKRQRMRSTNMGDGAERLGRRICLLGTTNSDWMTDSTSPSCVCDTYEGYGTALFWRGVGNHEMECYGGKFGMSIHERTNGDSYRVE